MISASCQQFLREQSLHISRGTLPRLAARKERPQTGGHFVDVTAEGGEEADLSDDIGIPKHKRIAISVIHHS